MQPKLRYFKLSEFDQHGLPGSGEKMDRHFLKMLDELRHQCGFPFIITSGYRSPEYNAQVSHTGLNGPHTTGRAVDIKVYGGRAEALLHYAMVMGFTGFGISQRGPRQSRFIHIDALTKADGFETRPWVWSY